MPNFDESRQADLQVIDAKLHDVHTSRRGKRYLQRSRAAILDQRNDTYVRNLRNRLMRATQANDASEVNKIQEQLHAYDRKKGYDQEEHSTKK
jgi:hypothetical protein